MRRDLFGTFLHSIARKAGYILCALALAAVLSWLGMGEAKAQGHPDTDQGRAFMHCSANGKAQVGRTQTFGGGAARVESYTCVRSTGNPNSQYRCSTVVKFISSGNNVTTNGSCTSSSIDTLSSATNDVHLYPAAATCSARADLGGLYQSNFQNGPTVCSFGCKYDQSSKQSDTTITDASGTNSLRFGVLLGGKATADTCLNDNGAEEPPEKGEEPPPCLAIGTDSAGTIYHCPKEDGSSCTVSGRGTKFCQPPPPGTQGPKVDTGRQDGNSQSAALGNAPQAPAPRPGETWAPGPGSTVCNNVSGACVQSNTYNNTGTPNVNGAPLPGDGSGPSGTGQQDSGGEGTGDGEGSGEGTDMGPTNAKLDGIKGTMDNIKDYLLGTGLPSSDAQFDAQVAAAFGGEDEMPDFDAETDDPTEGVKVIQDGNWLTEQLDDSGFLGGGSCPADRQVMVGTTSIPLTFGPICGLLSAVSGLVMAASYLLAFRIMTS